MARLHRRTLPNKEEETRPRRIPCPARNTGTPPGLVPDGGWAAGDDGPGCRPRPGRKFRPGVRRLPPLRPGPQSLLRHPNFLCLLASQTVSQLGTQVSALALPLLAIVVVDATPFQVALVGAIQFLPFLLLSLPAGVWVDRLPRRTILIVCEVGSAVLVLSIPAAQAAGMLTLEHLYGVGFLKGVCAVFADVARQAYLPTLVERDRLLEGNARM
jgi:hypothetical protein